ncbi:MAG: hypothetical protein RJB38_587 [Pseudomonadota bacterium]
MGYSRQKHDSAEEGMVRSLDDLALFDELILSLLPKLRRMIAERWSPDKIRREVGSYAQARMAHIALTGDARKATTLNAIKDMLDRHEGTATRKVEVTQKYAQMEKAELAALALQKLKDAGLISESGSIAGDHVQLKLSAPLHGKKAKEPG